ncbi:MAG: ADP-ribosylglycohydrolase family protein [Kutzneria sp.]|nr:ADP-ribosylglycohydrolase family protein [Kutzneria sp.]
MERRIRLADPGRHDFPIGLDEADRGVVVADRTVPWQERVLGCMLAGAVGDALGAPIEFLPIDMIRRRYGTAGVTGLGEDGPDGTVTDDTQMTLFTLEGLIRAHVRLRTARAADPVPIVQHAYQRWLHTQGVEWALAGGPFTDGRDEPDGWLVTEPRLFERRAPGNTCLTALRAFAAGEPAGSFVNRINDAKGCGGVMRAAPAALWSTDPVEVFALGAATAALTHGHPSGYLAAGALAFLVHGLLTSSPLPATLASLAKVLRRWNGHEDQLARLEAAVRLADEGRVSPDRLAEKLGGGWVGEEALAIATYSVLVTDNLADALCVSVNHSGDSDSTGSVCGNLAGAYYGVRAIPPTWLNHLEMRDVITMLSEDALAEFGQRPPGDERWAWRYPGR